MAIRYNNELCQLLGEPDIIKEVKARRVRWLGHQMNQILVGSEHSQDQRALDGWGDPHKDGRNAPRKI
jgi:hypothetical protein